MTNPTSGFDKVPVFGTFHNPADETPRAGRIRLTFATRIYSVNGAFIYPAGTTREYVLDAAGSFTAQVPASDDPDVFPNGWQVKVEELLDGGGGLVYFIVPVLTLLSVGLNLANVRPPASAPAAGEVFTLGVPNGIARLNSAGLVVNADGTPPAGTGGGTGSPPTTNAADLTAGVLDPARLGAATIPASKLGADVPTSAQVTAVSTSVTAETVRAGTAEGNLSTALASGLVARVVTASGVTRTWWRSAAQGFPSPAEGAVDGDWLVLET